MENGRDNSNNESNIVLTSRVRLARNLRCVPFPDSLDNEKARDIVKKIDDEFYNLYDEKEFKTIYLWNRDKISNYEFIEKHLISPKLISNSEKSAFIINSDESTCIMINEEDHLRIQCLKEGLDLEGAFRKADEIDNKLEEKLDFAFDEKLGYLTACPTNIGTGLRASVMIHLPALVMEKEIEKVLTAISHLGMTIRGIYGEGSKSHGNLFQISNQITLGVSEHDIITNIIAVINEIINQEYLAREGIIEKYKYELEDKIYRSIGILKSAVILGFSECLSLLSYLRLGYEMGIIDNIDKNIINDLLILSQPSMIQKNQEKILNKKDLNMKRAELIKNILKNNI
ncbi:protein arginine kinase [Haloimpatiens sp. FM7315]|uniref:protein arginine kinase n=1 Tax=Haloimpatiens sp. FM7315 TaxID=3298609 RepID=UPI0035A390F5